MASSEVEQLIRVLYRIVGNKVFMRDVEKLFHTHLSELSPYDTESLRLLANALAQKADL